jgi:TetR/AcrR family transcriptional regulator, tetracycline repressor protein
MRPTTSGKLIAMGRPKEPLLSRDVVITAAVRIIDEEGINALTTRRLAQDLKVTGPALYYHFADMMEVVTGAVTRVLSKVKPPPEEGIDWREWMLVFTTRTRAVLLQHPNLVPAMVYHVPRTLAPDLYEICARLMTEAGLSPRIIIPMMEEVEMYMLGHVSYSVVPASDVHKFGSLSAARFPNLRKAVSAAPINDEDRFRISVAAILDGWVEADLPRRRRQMNATR